MTVEVTKIQSLAGTPAAAMCDAAAQQIGTIMQVCGIRHMKVEPIQCGGVSRSRAVDAQFFEGVPESVRSIGNALLEPIADLILSFASTDVMLRPGDNDMEHLSKVWSMAEKKDTRRLVFPAEMSPGNARRVDAP